MKRIRLSGASWTVLVAAIGGASCHDLRYVEDRAGDSGVTNKDSEAGLGPGDATGGDSHDAVADGQAAKMPWGEYTTTLGGLPSCASPATVLTVNTSDEELDGGEGISDLSQAGARLSLHEAFWIAYNNDNEAHTILFDPSVFPVRGADPIVVSGRYGLPANNRRLCVDGRDRGVEIRWELDPEELFPNEHVPSMVQDAVLVGLSLRGLPASIGVSGGSQVAGCLLEGYKPVEARAGNSVVGPENVFGAGTFGLTIQGLTASDPMIVDNHFGYDPRDGSLYDLQSGITAFGGATVAGNVFAAMNLHIHGIIRDGQRITLRQNFFGADRTGRRLRAQATGMSSAGGGAWTFGPGNLFVDQLLRVGDSLVEVTRNSFADGAQFLHGRGTGPTPPQLLTATIDGATGTCAAAGRVELFSGDRAEDAGKNFRGEVSCDGTNPWLIEVELPRGHYVSATLTDAQRRTSEFSPPRVLP